MTTDTFERLRAILLRDYPLDAAALTPDAPLEALGIDSLGLAELLFNVEEEFAIRLPPEPARLPTLADVVAYIDGLIAEQRSRDTTPGGAAPAGVAPTPGAALPAAAASPAAADAASATAALPAEAPEGVVPAPAERPPATP